MKNTATISAAVIALGIGAFLAPVRAQRTPQRPATPAGPWMNQSLSPDQRADLLLGEMTLEEKLSLVHGTGMIRNGTVSDPVLLRSNGGAGFIPGIPRLGIPDLQMADAAVGVARGAQRGRYSTPLPSAVAEAASWDPQLAAQYGALIGQELRDQGYTMSLGGGINLTREPRNGRNFEYKGEDPILAGTLAGAEIKALQAQGVIGDIKHYAFNDQETGRNSGSTNLEKRAMRETDLLAFEIGIRDSGVGAVMCSYNRINSVYACENDYTLRQVLKGAFGFKGFVVSDWGGTHSTTKAALAGLDIEMPGSTYFGTELAKAVRDQDVPMSRLDDMVHRVLRSEFAAGLFDGGRQTKVPDIFAGFAVAQRVEEQGAVLLKNAPGQLPLNASQIRSIAVIGSHADAGVLSGGGSAQVDPPGGNPVPPPARADRDAIFGRGPVYQPSSPLQAIRAKAGHAKVSYDPGSDPAAAARAAQGADAAIVFVNQPASEGRDLPSLSLPDNQDALVAAVAAANPHTIVVLESGGAITMPWIDQVGGVLSAWYPGIRGGEAIANILFGDVNPSGKLPLTFPKSEADLPHPKIAAPLVAAGGQPGERQPPPPFDINYTEGLQVGYKWYDAEGKQPLFPFGYGLSYSTYSYSDLRAAMSGHSLKVDFKVSNTGNRAGAEIAQVYLSFPRSAGEPPQRLVAWQRVTLDRGATKEVSLTVEPLYQSIFDAGRDAWQVVAGDYTVRAGGSSRDLPLTTQIHIAP